MTRSSFAWSLVPLLLIAIADGLLAADPAREIRGHRTIHGAESSERANPIPPRYVYGEHRDWRQEPYRLAVLLVEFSDTKHQAIHSAALYDEMLFSRNRYKRKPDNGPFPSFELTLPGPADTSTRDQSTRRVTWPTDAAGTFEVARDGEESGVALRNIRKDGELIFFEVGPP